MLLLRFTNRPREAMRVQAGFPKTQGCFFLKRAVVQPSSELLRLVFPEADQWSSKLKDNGYDCDGDLTAENFVEMMIQLRTVLIWDSVEMKTAFPNHVMITHTLWQSELYLRQVKEFPDVTLFEVAVESVVPLVANRLKALEHSHTQSNVQQTQAYPA